MNKSILDNLLTQAMYNQSADPPTEQVVFRINFKKIGSLGDFILYSGRPKSGKTKYLSGFIAAAVSRNEIFSMNVRLPQEKNEVVHFDTEQSKFSHFKMMELVTRLMDAKELPPHFKSFRCRSMSGAQILAVIEHYLKMNPRTGVVCLDGLLDTIDSMNDTAASSSMKNWLKRITEDHNVLLAGVIHRGFSSDKSIGHIGSDGERAAQTVLLVEKNKELKQYILRAEYMRDDDEFPPVAIYYNNQLSLWQLTDFIEEDKQERRGIRKKSAPEYDIEEHQANVRRIFNTAHTQDYRTVCQNIAEEYNIGLSSAKAFLNYLKVDAGLIFKTETGYTNSKTVRLFVDVK